MILSEFAGAAQSLNGSLIINPWDVHATANAIHAAMTMGAEDRADNYTKLSKYVDRYTAERWGTTFVKELTRITDADKPANLEKSLADAHITGE